MKRLYSVNFICLCIFVIYVHLPRKFYDYDTPLFASGDERRLD